MFAGLEDRARELVQRSPQLKIGRTLYLNVLEKSARSAKQRGDVDELDRLAELLRFESSDVAARFFNDPDAIKTQARIELLLGNPSEAALFARGALNSIERGVVLEMSCY